MDTESPLSPGVSVTRAENSSATSPFAPRNWLLPLLLIVAPLLMLVIYSRAMFPGLTNADALDFAQVGRNISAGRGMVTYVLHPLALTHGTSALRQPDVIHGPLFPFLLALAFGAVGAKDSVASAVSGLFYLMTVPLVYILGARVFNRSVGLITAAAFAFSSLMLEYAISGLHITLYTFLVTALFLVLYNLAADKQGQASLSESPPPPKLLLLAGALTAMLYMTDVVFFWLVPIVLGSVAWISGSERRNALLKFLLPLGLFMLPCMLRNLLLTGNPVFGLRGTELWMNTAGHFPGRVAYRLTSEEFTRGLYLIPAVGKKALLGLNTVIQGMPQISDTWLLAFLLPCLLFGYTSFAATMLRRIMMFSALALLFGMVLFEIQMPLFCCLVPTMLVFAIAYLTHLVKQAKLSALSLGTVTTLLGITIAYPLATQMILQEGMQAMPEVVAAKALGKMAQPQQIVLSDRPDLVAWYADRAAIQIPAIDAQVAAIRARFPEMRWLFLTPETREQSAQWEYLYDRYATWNRAYLQAQTTSSGAPSALQIPENGQPLFDALVGFTSVSPVTGSSPSTVIAVLSEANLSMGFGSTRNTVP